MTRPRVALSDDQARILVARLPSIEEQHPVGTGSNRLFVRDFIRTVHLATGKTYGPLIYRRLLKAFAPDRRPSNETLAQEKKLLDTALAEEATAGRQIDQGTSQELSNVVERVVDGVMKRQRPITVAEPSNDQFINAQLDFLQSRLVVTERLLNESREQAARLAGELQATHAVRDVLQANVDTGNAQVTDLTKKLAALTEEMAGMRKFAMTAIDTARGETRARQEWVANLEAQVKAEKEHTEVFRRLAYRAGAPLPAEVKGSGT